MASEHRTPSFKAGDWVRLTGIPDNVQDIDDLKTRSLFQKCLGKVFQVSAVEAVEGLPTALVRIEVGHVSGKEKDLETIWVEPEFLELVGPS